MLFPSATSAQWPLTRLVMADSSVGDDLPDVIAVFAGRDAGAFGQAVDQDPRPRTLLVEHALNVFTRPGLRGQRMSGGILTDGANGSDDADAGDNLKAGRAWSPRFKMTKPATVSDDMLRYEARDDDAGLVLATEVEALKGGSLRVRHTLINVASGSYMLEGLDVHVPLGDDMTEFLDFCGRHERERQPQRHQVADGMWLREFRKGKPGYAGPLIVAGTQGFDFRHGSVLMVQVSWSGNSAIAVDRDDEQSAGINAGELLLPGEIVLAKGESYTTPWVMVTASNEGLDGAAQSVHAWERSLATHPKTQPMTLNVWEAVMFRHDFSKLKKLAKIAADVGVERYVLDDGWFHLRRDDHAGLGDWWVDPDTWPNGLKPLSDYVRGLGMQFGLWIELEMINPDSDLYRKHPDWIMQASSRTPIEQRHQLVLDLTNPAAFDYVFSSISKVLSQTGVDYIKWDHNRFLLEAGSNLRGGAPAVHAQTEAFYRLLDKLRAAFPDIEWESCASGGGRIDTGIVEKVSRFWCSDMTDAMSRQKIQRWTAQTVAPEYIGAHISQPCSQQTERTLSLAFRAATAVFFSFGIEWDLTQANEVDLKELATWIAWYKDNRDFLHSGKFVRLDLADSAVLGYGVVADDGSRAIIEHVQYDESRSNRGIYLRIPGLDESAQYKVRWTALPQLSAPLESFDSYGPLGDVAVSGKYLMTVGVRIPRCRPETERIFEILKQ
ncbi:alpha-galactosidase [Bifidobacterium sp. ESL0690]|uniref:alpha-galactosidase n=1 Tax=Bifidobacterium sp. ESL0690 TaxID=2983214 RepID=UPI0023F96F87|nr:alpha-galactosidase [Bifidobacterium sp. ESL0690]WEV46781.1 alpha-galactosidase [Bifidobacterium sp. ESL0690]